MKFNILIIILVFLFLLNAANAQKPGWQHLDLQTDSVFGMSTDKAYKELLTGKKAKLVTVAVIDCGTDTLQQDLKNILWTDPKDGSHGRNFIGKEAGTEDVVKLAILSKQKGIDTANYGHLYGTSAALAAKRKSMKSTLQQLEMARDIADTITKRIGKSNPSATDFINYRWRDSQEAYVIGFILRCCNFYRDWQVCKKAELIDPIAQTRFHLDQGLNPENKDTSKSAINSDIGADPTGMVEDQNDGGCWHGTHVAGIIGAIDDKATGMKGVANNVRIMTLKVTGNVREMRDESLALAIRYAADHDAKVINMSFGKTYSWNKKAVDEAVQYAMSKDVLIVSAAGNNHQDLDKEPKFPNPVYRNKPGRAEAWIEVGASGYKNDSTIMPKFSNYGKTTVDVFAPGVAIYSTLPHNCYDSWEGTSMATPMVAGLAAIIRGYYPKLSAKQVHDIISQSVVKTKYLADKCRTGGVVNTYQALKLAATLKSI